MADTLATIRAAVGYVGVGSRVTGQATTLLAGAQAGAEIGQVTGPVGAVAGLVTGGLTLAGAKTQEQQIQGGINVATGALATAIAVANYIGAAIASTLTAVAGVIALPVAVVGLGVSNSISQQAEKIKNAVHELNTINRDLPVIIGQMTAPLRFLPLVRFIPRLTDEKEKTAILKQYNFVGTLAQSGGAGWSHAQAILESGNAARNGAPLPENLKAAMTKGSLYGILLRLVTQDILARRAQTFNVSYPLGVIGKEQVIPWLAGYAIGRPLTITGQLVTTRTRTIDGHWEAGDGGAVWLDQQVVPDTKVMQYGFVTGTGEPLYEQVEGGAMLVGERQITTPLGDTLTHYYLASDKPGISLQAIIAFFDTVDRPAFRQSMMYQAITTHQLVETLQAMTPANAQANVARVLTVQATAGSGVDQPESILQAALQGDTAALEAARQAREDQLAEAARIAANTLAMEAGGQFNPGSLGQTGG